MTKCYSGSCFLAQATFATDTGMRLTIPRTSHPPTLDGKLARRMGHAAALTGIINQFDGVAHPRQATFWLKYSVQVRVTSAQRSTLLPGEKARMCHAAVVFQGQPETGSDCARAESEYELRRHAELVPVHGETSRVRT